MMSSCTSVAVWMNSTTDGVEHGAIAGVAAQPRRHQQHRRTHALAAALLDVAAHLGNQRDARLDVAHELLLDALEILADRLEDLRQIRRHGEILGGVAQMDVVRLSTHNIGLSTECQRAKPLRCADFGREKRAKLG